MADKTIEQALKDRADKAKAKAAVGTPTAEAIAKPAVEADHAAPTGAVDANGKRIWPKPGSQEYAGLTPMEKAHATRAHRGPGKPEDRPKYLVFGRKIGGSVVLLIGEFPTASRAERWIADSSFLLEQLYDRIEIRRAKVYRVVKEG